MRRIFRFGAADGLVSGLGIAALAVFVWLPLTAYARSCADPGQVATVLRLLSDRLALSGSLTLVRIRRVPSDPATGGPTCEADIDGIRDGPTIFGRALDMVRYWDDVTPDAAAQPVVSARLMPRTGAPTPPALVNATPPSR